MFLGNDPWVGAAHQMDVTLLTPVFREGRLSCWVTNVLLLEATREDYERVARHWAWSSRRCRPSGGASC